MSKDIQCTVYGKRAELFQQVFGTNTVYLENAIGEMANLPERGKCHIYKLDMAQVTPEQRAKLVSSLAARFGLSEQEISTDIDATGVPILAEDCVLTISDTVARSLLSDDMDWSES